MSVPLATLTSTIGEVPTTPVGPVVCAASRCVPLATVVVFQFSVYGALGRAGPSGTPSSNIWTLAPDAVVAVRVTVPKSGPAGALKEIDGGGASDGTTV